MAGHEVPEVMPEYEAERIREQASADVTPELQQQLAFLGAPAWYGKNPGDTLSGQIVTIQRAELDNEFGHQVYPKIIVENSVGYYAVHVLGEILSNRFNELKPSVGDRLTIQYHGKVKAKNSDRTYQNLTVMVGDVATVEDWKF